MDTWKELLADKRKRQADAFPKDWIITPPPADQLDVTELPLTCGLLTPSELEITETEDVAIILDKLARGEWSSISVTRAFYKRAIIAQQVTSCLTEIFVERALARAAECDEYLRRNGKPIGPLHGLPVSLKDQIRIQGLEATMGYASWIGQFAERDSTLVSILHEAGAVPFVKTNLPQTLMWPETYNGIFGRTVNPYNRNLTSGGSSGGEGALIAMKGSPLGVGTDIGGSIRIPSTFNGLYGLRPSYNRIPFEGCANSLDGLETITTVAGPLSTSLSGVKAFTKAILNLKPWTKDPFAVRKPWDEELYRLQEHGGGNKLCFAILWDDGAIRPHPPILRALETTKKALEVQGHKVIDWPAFDYASLYKTLLNVFAAGVQEDIVNVCEKTGEPIITTMDPEGPKEGVPPLLPSIPLSAFQLWQLQKQKAEMRKAHLELWESTASLTGTGRPVDAIISPVAASAAPPHGKNKYVGYTLIWNGLDTPSCTFPVSKVNQFVDVKQPPHKFLSIYDEEYYNLYDPEVFKNAPVGLQLVGHTLEDEAVIGMTEIVDAALKSFSNKAKLDVSAGPQSEPEPQSQNKCVIS